jgi:S1-C subfamily serine protease
VELEEDDNGVAQYKVEHDSPAVKGGLHDGDIVTQADDVQIKTYNNLIDFLNKHKPGDEVKFKILRGKEEMTVSVTLGKRPEGK